MPKTELGPFEQALLDAALEEFADIPSEEEISLTFSEEFEEAGAELVEKARRGKVPSVSRTLRRVLLVAAIVAALATTVMATPSFRDAVIRFFSSNAGTHYEFSFDPEQAATAPEYIEKVYKPTYIPEGFSEDFAYVDIGYVCYIWLSESGESISFDQMTIPNDSEGPAPDAEQSTVETLNLNGYEVFCVSREGEGTIYYWTDNAYFYQLYYGVSISREEGNKIFYSIAWDQNAVIPEY